MSLPIFHTDDKDFQLMQTKWSAQLNPILANPANQLLILKNISLAAGSNVINHKLGSKLQGWTLTRQRAQATISDEQDTNPTPQLTLVLVASAPCVVDIGVF